MVDGIKDECYGILYGYRGVDSYALILFLYQSQLLL